MPDQEIPEEKLLEKESRAENVLREKKMESTKLQIENLELRSYILDLQAALWEADVEYPETSATKNF